MIRENRFCVVIFCLIRIFWQGAGHAQALHYPPKQNFLKSFSATLGGDVAHVFSSPLRLKQKDCMKLLAVTAGTVVFVNLLDRRIDASFIERDDAYVISAIELAKIGEGYGNISIEYVLVALSGSMLASGLIFNDGKLLKTGGLMVEALVISGAITQIGKTVFGRARPYTGKGPTEFEWPEFRIASDMRSFPSGHTASAFAMMTVLAKQYDRWWVKIPAYTVAVSVALQRIDSRNHWGADVVVGGALGYWVGNTLVARHKRRQSQSLSVNPHISANRVGLSVEF